MDKNLLRDEWANIESDDLRVLIAERIGGPGQFSGQAGDNRLYLPLAGKNCRLVLRFKRNRISGIERGVAFNAGEWERIAATVHELTTTSPNKIGRNITFSGHRVTGWWRGSKSGVQITPPPAGAPTAPVEIAEHPFVLEFPIHSDSAWPVTNARRLREHRKVALLLNVLLATRINVEPRQHQHGWTCLGLEGDQFRCAWLQRSYFADIGQVVTDVFSTQVGDPVAEVAADAYYAISGHDGNPMRVPSDLDESICHYRQLNQENREKFDRALFWLDVASTQWFTSMSSSFAALVSAIEALTERGVKHRTHCGECGMDREHDAPGPTALFRDFLETYAPGKSLKKRRDEMYALRSDILHGNSLLSFDEGRAFGWDPPWSNQRDLHGELWSITRIALRNFLNAFGATKSCPSRVPGAIDA